MHRGSLAVPPCLPPVFVSATSAQQPAARKNITLKDMIGQPTYGGYQLSPDGKRRCSPGPIVIRGTDGHVGFATSSSLQLTIAARATRASCPTDASRSRRIATRERVVRDLAERR